MPRPDPNFPANLQVYFPSIPGALDYEQLRKGCQWGNLRTERVHHDISFLHLFVISFINWKQPILARDGVGKFCCKSLTKHPSYTCKVFAVPGDYTVTTSGYAVFEEEWMAHQVEQVHVLNHIEFQADFQVLSYGYVTANVYRGDLLVQQGLQVLAVEFPQQHLDRGVKREWQEEKRHNSSKRIKVGAKTKEEVDDET